MGWCRAAAWTAAIAATAVIGPALEPVAHGQARTPRPAEPARVVQMFSGQGSWIGVSVREVASEDAAKMKVAGLGGALVEEVTRDSPAETAGLKAGDIIVEFDGERVRHPPAHASRAGDAGGPESPGVRRARRTARAAERRATSLRPEFLRRAGRAPEEPRDGSSRRPGAPRAASRPCRQLPHHRLYRRRPLRRRCAISTSTSIWLLWPRSARLGVNVIDPQPQLAEYSASRTACS